MSKQIQAEKIFTQTVVKKLLFLGIFFYQASIGVIAGPPSHTPVISIIIDDIGYRQKEDLRAIALPGSLAYAIMPLSPNARIMSQIASKNGKTILIHMPMQAMEEDKNQYLGPGALRLEMTRKEFMNTLETNLRNLPDAVGVNNHMGSLITQHPGHMEWLMESLNINDKFYLDSLTSSHSIARRLAYELKVPYLKRDVFLDNLQDEAYIQGQFEELVRVAKRNGKAIAIGHPHPETIRVLGKNLLELEKYGVNLVSLLDLLKSRTKSAPF